MPESKEVEVKDYEVFIDLDGTKTQKYDKPLIAEDSYVGEIRGVKLQEVRKFEGPGTKMQLIFTVEVRDGSLEKPLELPMFVNPVISKSNGTKGNSNSKLFNILDKADMLDQVRVDAEELAMLDSLAVWLNTNMLGLMCKVVVSTTNKGTENAYSTVKDIIRFGNDAEVKKE